MQEGRRSRRVGGAGGWAVQEGKRCRRIGGYLYTDIVSEDKIFLVKFVISNIRINLGLLRLNK